MTGNKIIRLFGIGLFLLLVWRETIAQDKTPHLFNIPAAALSDTLIVFAQQAGLSILVDASASEGFIAPALIGVMTITEGLQRLLAGTGLGYHYINPTTITISADFALPGEHSEPAGLSASDTGQRATVTIDNVIVTALRQRESLQKTSAAVSVLDQHMLQYDAISTLNEVSSRVPGLTVSSFSLGQPSIHMRGIGSNDDGAAMDNSVVVFIDDVYMGRITGMNLDMFDMYQVEVLRGPQGVLYGKNVIGGAIKLTTNSPTDETQLKLKLSTGNFNHQAISLLANGALADDQSLLGRIALQGTRRDGWQDNILVGGDKQHNNNEWHFRSHLLYEPGPEVEFHWSIDYSQNNLNSSGRIPVRSGTALQIVDTNGDPVPIPGGAEGEFQHRFPTDIFARLGGGPKQAANSVQGFTDRTIAGVNQRFSYPFNDINFIAITAWRGTQFNWLEDSIGLPSFSTSQTIALLDDESHNQFSQEFRWSTAPDAPISTVLGLYYLYEHSHRVESFLFKTTTAVSNQNNRNRSYAAFGQLNFAIAPALEMSLGGRYTYDRKKLRQSAGNGGASSIIFENFQLSSTASWEDFSPRISLTLNAHKDLLVYSSISRGFKSGGFQGVPATKALAAKEISPENAWEYELGVKSEWLNNRLRLNVAGFYTDYRDLQVVQFRSVDNFGLFQTSNAASASVKGVEVEWSAQLSNHLNVSGSYAYLKATYDRFNDAQNRNFSGNSLRQAPKNSASVAIQYKRPLLGGSLRLRADYRYQSISFREPDNSFAHLPGYRLVDANIHFLTADERWELSLWARNVLDEEYISHLYVLGGNDYALYGTPREYGFSVSWAFL